MDKTAPLIWRLGDKIAGGVSHGFGVGKGGRVAPSHVARLCGVVCGTVLATAALWMGQRLSFEGWATEMRQGFSRGFGGGGDGRVAPCRVVRFWGDGQQCAPCSTSNVHFVDGTEPLVWRLGDRKAVGRLWGISTAHLGECQMCWKKAIASTGNVFANATNFEDNIVLFRVANKEQEENCCLEAYQHSLVIDCRAREEIGS